MVAGVWNWHAWSLANARFSFISRRARLAPSSHANEHHSASPTNATSRITSLGARSPGLALATGPEQHHVRGTTAQQPAPLSPVTEFEGGEQLAPSPVLAAHPCGTVPDDSSGAGMAGGMQEARGGAAVETESNTARGSGVALLDVEITDDDLRTELYKKIIHDHHSPPRQLRSRSAHEPPEPRGSPFKTADRRREALVVPGYSTPGSHASPWAEAPALSSLSMADGVAALSKALAECEVAFDRCAFLSAVRWARRGGMAVRWGRGEGERIGEARGTGRLRVQHGWSTSRGVVE